MGALRRCKTFGKGAGRGHAECLSAAAKPLIVHVPVIICALRVSFLQAWLDLLPELRSVAARRVATHVRWSGTGHSRLDSSGLGCAVLRLPIVRDGSQARQGLVRAVGPPDTRSDNGAHVPAPHGAGSGTRGVARGACTVLPRMPSPPPSGALPGRCDLPRLAAVLQRLAAACIFLAAKVEEASLRTNDMLNAVAAQAAGAAVGDGSALARFPCLVGDAYQAAKRQLIQDEQQVLRRLRFDIGVDQPHRHLYVLARCWGASREALCVAVCLLNDAVCHCAGYGGMRLPPAAAAAAALHIGAQLCGQAVQPAGWWHATGVNADPAMRVACGSLLELIGG